MNDPVIQLMQAGSFTMTIFAAILILVVTRNIDDPQKRTRISLGMIGFALLLFGFPLYGEVLAGGPLSEIGTIFASLGTTARIAAAIFLPYGLYSLSATDPRRAPTRPEDAAGDV